MAKIPAWLTSQDSKVWPALSRVSSIFGIITPAGAVLAFVLTGAFAAPALILAVYLCVLSFTLVVLLLRQEGRYLREARFAPALLPMRLAYTAVASAAWHLYHGDGSQDAFRLRLRESLRRFAESFTLVTGAQCRACIKVIQADPSGKDVLVSTLCRDNEEDEPPRHRPDRVADNTDFRQIFTQNKAFFFSNDLVAQLKYGYQNSHWDEEDLKNDSLDYRATIVWPIERAAIPTPGAQPAREILGFLCIDTKKTEVFQQTYDEALGASFAQALSLVLYRLREQPSQSTQQS